MTARSREQGSHIGSPQGYEIADGSFRPDASSVPASPGIPSGPRPGGSPGQGSGPRPAGSRPGASRHRKPKPPPRKPLLSKRLRATGIIVVIAVVLGVGFETGFGKEASPESTVQNFLFDWQQGQYKQAASLTTGARDAVSGQLSSAYADLDASASFVSLGPIRQHGDTADAEYTATVDIAQGTHQWTYNGRFSLTDVNGKWLVDWAPSVINPSLRPGDRLAIVTSFPQRAQVQDQSGNPLQPQSLDYHVGVYPGSLADPARTASAFSAITGLSAPQVLGQLRAAPPRDFFSLLTLDPSSFSSLWPRLSAVPGLTFQRHTERLFASDTSSVIGSVGTENSRALHDEGVAYQPGDTVGLSGLEQAYQDSLAGTPTTSVVVIDGKGSKTSTLWTSQGHAGTPIRTTLSAKDQAAAGNVLAARSDSGEIVAVDSATGKILALAQHQGQSAPLPAGGPLNARIQPGMAFSIVSAAAMIGDGVQPKTPLPCYNSEAVGGQTFTYTGQQEQSTFASDFANGCGTALASMSTKLTPAQLAAAEKSFGIGRGWNLQLQAFSGSAQSTSAGASLASQVIGNSGVLVSPLGMAMIAAEVDSGTGHAPVLINGAPQAGWLPQLSGTQMGELRQLMREAVQSGSAVGANLPGQHSVYGQAGVVQTASNAWLSWFVGYRGTTAVAVLETGSSQQQAAAALAGSFLSRIG